ncbi:hypothetical protein THII_1432 [Thioploca ingrica]|uniref:Macro domain-containing protein n=1 Tax=Thioploca ingrica TaxID=40754 RepID=A0A090AFA0_9GAMM|nr:hypothetical protein THII_1432 [Thioploca ingrica]
MFFKGMNKNRFFQITVSLTKQLPVDTQAIVYEQDTTLILTAPTDIKYPVESNEQLLNQAITRSELIPGSVLVRNQFPWQFFAIVHDLNQEPTWQEQWIVMALQTILHESERRQLRSMAMPLLGTVHGSLTTTRFFELFRSVIASSVPTDLRQIQFYHLSKNISW